MSYSSLYGIKKNYVGEELCEYKNSWLFSPIVWDILSDKYLPRQYGMVQSIIGLNGNEVWSNINSIMNNSDNTPDRICWEMTNQQIFFTKDKECIVNNIRRFIEQNKEYDKYKDDDISPLEREHIIERFNEIANDIFELDEDEYPCFVFKNTSVDDGVVSWFYDNDENDGYINKSLKDWTEFVAEFIVIENGKIANFINNLNYKYE